MKINDKTAVPVSVDPNKLNAACPVDPFFCTDDIRTADDAEVLASSKKLLLRNQRVYEELAK